MTTKPTMELPITGTGHIVTTSEWNTNVVQNGTYVQEVLAGSNADKIPASALAGGIPITALVTTTGLIVWQNAGDNGKKLQIGGGTINAAGTSAAVNFFHTVAVSFGASFSTTPRLVASGDTSGGYPGTGAVPNSGGFTYYSWDSSGSASSRTFDYFAAA